MQRSKRSSANRSAGHPSRPRSRVTSRVRRPGSSAWLAVPTAIASGPDRYAGSASGLDHRPSSLTPCARTPSIAVPWSMACRRV